VVIQDRVAVVTGAAAGIGRAIATGLAREGADVVVADVDEEWGQETVALIRETGRRAVFSEVDVSSEDGVRRMIDAAVSELGGLDIVVNNAFEGTSNHFPDAAPGEWGRVIDVVLRGTMLGIQHGLAAMGPGGGAIVNVSSVAGLGTQPYSYPEYAAAKAAIIRLTGALGRLAEERNVRVNCVAPDWTATEFVRERFERMTPEERANATDGYGRPAPERLLEPADVAAAALDLIRDDAMVGRTLVMWCGEEPRLIPDDRWE
jgi:NAD(P)-dependent dehydrogenase (short-subunit alcohol dehydrogenase family)